MSMRLISLSFALNLIVCCPLFAQSSLQLDIEEPPISYSETPPENRVSRLQQAIANKAVSLDYTRAQGHLGSLLKALDISESSQVLVFSKTSLQIQFISRDNPRAIYFNDDTYVGWVHGSNIMEISTTDPKLGAAFYTVDMKPWRADITQRTYDCLACHATSMTQGVPGHTVRSVHPKYDGTLDSQRDSFVTDERSPFAQRWGGWYVTGTHGSMQHMGNAFLRGGQLDTERNGNRSTLEELVDVSGYLTPHSDIHALMVLEHQTQAHNALARADLLVRQALHQQVTTGLASSDRDEWQIQLQSIAEEVVEHLLFRDEFTLTDQVSGTSNFAKEFVARGPHDEQGRSLRDFDMSTRLFKYPLSYLIYSSAFENLQPALQNEIRRQILAVLNNPEPHLYYRGLDGQTKSDILAILKSTKPDWFN